MKYWTGICTDQRFAKTLGVIAVVSQRRFVIMSNRLVQLGILANGGVLRLHAARITGNAGDHTIS